MEGIKIRTLGKLSSPTISSCQSYRFPNIRQIRPIPNVKRFYSSTGSSVVVEEDGWKWNGTLLMWESPQIKHSPKIAAFDFDGCLVSTSLFRRGPDAWRILFPGIAQKLYQLQHDGYKLVIFSNQSDIGRSIHPETRDRAIAEKKGRFQGFVKSVGVPFQIFVATGKAPQKGKPIEDFYRKHNTGMWEYLKDNCNGGIPISLADSFFVGDSAGRPKDHGDYDKKFADAIPLKFYTEDEYFDTKK